MQAKCIGNQLVLQADVVVQGDLRKATHFERRCGVRGRHAVGQKVGKDDEILRRVQSAILADEAGLAVSVRAGIPGRHKNRIVPHDIRVPMVRYATLTWGRKPPFCSMKFETFKKESSAMISLPERLKELIRCHPMEFVHSSNA